MNNLKPLNEGNKLYLIILNNKSNRWISPSVEIGAAVD